MDINKDKFAIAKEFGCTDCYSPLDGPAGDYLKSKEQWGIDYTYDCTGNVRVMRDALEAAHRGFGESTVIGVAAAGQELSTRPFQLITGRTWKGTAFGGWKSRQDVPKLVNKTMLGELPLNKFITHSFQGLEKIQELIDALHGGECLRGVMNIVHKTEEIKYHVSVDKQVKTFGGVLKTVSHDSKVLNCRMTFNIFLPADSIKDQRSKPFPVLYYLSGLTCTQDNAAQKSGFARYAKKHNICMVFPDTSPRNCDIAELEGNSDWTIGYGAGHYCDATAAPYANNFNMFTYVTEELPALINEFFPVDPTKKSVMGHSMGGNGALMVATKCRQNYRSASAFAPIGNTTGSSFCS
jgi:hypothetical protein